MVNSKGLFPPELNQHCHLLWGELWLGGIVTEKPGDLAGCTNVSLALYQVQEQVMHCRFFTRPQIVWCQVRLYPGVLDIMGKACRIAPPLRYLLILLPIPFSDTRSVSAVMPV
jgi:hypothetical protein